MSLRRFVPYHYPSKDSPFDRVRYFPGESIQLIEYQYEMVNEKGEIFWKTVDEIMINSVTRCKEFKEKLIDAYEKCSMKSN